MKNLLKKYKVVLILVSLLFLYTFICAISYAESTSENIADSVFRLHVIANSDSKEDQDLKYKVRDALLSYMNSITSNCNSKQEVIEVAKEHSKDFEDIAIKTMAENGYAYPVKVEIGQFDFPTKIYGDISFPSGTYDALKVELGKAKGQNWWCVMFPPLCFIDISSGVVPDESKQYLKNNMSEEEYALVSNKDDIGINFKFKLLEFFADNKLLSAKK